MHSLVTKRFRNFYLTDSDTNAVHHARSQDVVSERGVEGLDTVSEYESLSADNFDFFSTKMLHFDAFSYAVE